MRIRVIAFSDFENFCEEQKISIGITELTDEQFNQIYQQSGQDWEFHSLKDFADEFNTDGPFAPLPSDHIIRFFPNE